MKISQISLGPRTVGCALSNAIGNPIRVSCRLCKVSPRGVCIAGRILSRETLKVNSQINCTWWMLCGHLTFNGSISIFHVSSPLFIKKIFLSSKSLGSWQHHRVTQQTASTVTDKLKVMTPTFVCWDIWEPLFFVTRLMSTTVPATVVYVPLSLAKSSRMLFSEASM